MFEEGWDVGRDENERCDLVFLFKGVILPPADVLIG